MNRIARSLAVPLALLTQVFAASLLHAAGGLPVVLACSGAASPDGMTHKVFLVRAQDGLYSSRYVLSRTPGLTVTGEQAVILEERLSCEYPTNDRREILCRGNEAMFASVRTERGFHVLVGERAKSKGVPSRFDFDYLVGCSTFPQYLPR